MNAEVEADGTLRLAEDDPDDQILIEEALKQNQLSGGLRFVGDGEECMDYLYNRGKYADKRNSPRPDLILLDLNLPRKDGREVLVEIKANPVSDQRFPPAKRPLLLSESFPFPLPL